jgi:3-hydroxyacyl-[acyl-carrier-protein] dehydratase
MLYNSNDIQKIIPHRYPFLLVDAIEEMDTEAGTITGRKCVSANEMQFLGHFPQQHVMPGVLIVEALAQTGAVLLLSKPEYKGKIAFFAGIKNMRFNKQVIPGDVLELKVELLKSKANIYFASVEALVEGKTACKGEIMCAVQG